MTSKPKKYFTILETWGDREHGKCSTNLCWLYADYTEARRHFNALVRAERRDGILSTKKEDIVVEKTKDYFFARDRYVEDYWVQIEIIAAETMDKFVEGVGGVQ
jgi:hypothetical protein